MVKVSVITVAFQSERVIERTIESILAQDYTAIEYWIIEGAGTDRTIEIANQYAECFREKGISYHVVSEPDRGIYDAMNKGIQLATGDIIGILNSGDMYETDAVSSAVEAFEENGCDLMFGNITIHKANGKSFQKKARQRKFYQTSRDWNHPTMFVKSELYKQYPFPNKGVHDDYAFYLRMRKENRKVVVADKVMAGFYMGGVSNHKEFKAAWRRIQDRYQYCYRANGYSRWYILECIFMETVKWILG